MAGAGVQQRTNAHLGYLARAGRLVIENSDLVFSGYPHPQYTSSFPYGAEVAVSRCSDRHLVSFVSGAHVTTIPIAHPIQIAAVDNAAAKLAARVGPSGPVEPLYPIALKFAGEDFGFTRIVYFTMRGEVAIDVVGARPGPMQAVLYSYANHARGRARFRYGIIARPRPMYFDG